MKSRITYLRQHDAAFDPQQLQVEGGTMHVHALVAAKQHRLTIGLDELPAELRDVLDQLQDLRIRWQQSRAYDTIPPLVSRIPPGLHVSFTPRRDGDIPDLCPLLKHAFSQDIPCSSNSTFTSPSPSTYQFYTPLASLDALSAYLPYLDPTSTASLDIDYSAPVFQITSYFPPATFTDTHTLSHPTSRAEIGILTPEPADAPHEVKLAGVLTVLAEHDAPTATRFAFPAQHHPAHASFNASWDHPTGTHPTLALSFAGLSPPAEQCALHAYLALPKAVFLDKYQFRDALFLQAHGLKGLRFLRGATDLEAPDWMVQEWGSVSVFELAPREGVCRIPMHLRYLPPKAGGYVDAAVPWPSVFWACEGQSAGVSYGKGPFDRVGLGWEGVFGGESVFYYLNSRGGQMMMGLKVPVLDAARTEWISAVTMGVVSVGFVWLVWVVLRGWMHGGEGGDGERKKRQ